ncbi:MAG: DUF4105 domain-containing protein [Gemmatimonadetes bacterium]|nr:DUF4105 domain-containing protein [Gemmatimonadota bacterium]
MWNRFGHNGLWIQDARTGEDWVWNWGIFDFDQVGFVPRLAQGTMLYSMRGYSIDATLAQYRAEGRDVWAQELNLTPAQKSDLDRYVRTNAQPANRDYIYNYYLDNCSTRVRDALDHVLGGAIRTHFSGLASGRTWRWHTRRLVEPSPWVYGGIALVLGPRGDESISQYEEMFLPMELRDRMAGFFIEGRDGTMRPLVAAETRLVEGVQPPPPEAPGPGWPGYLLMGLGGAAVVLLAGAGTAGAGAARRMIATIPIVAWSLLAGVAGLVLTGAYLTDHVFWFRNENLLQATPLSLLLAVAVMGAAWRPSWRARAAGLATLIAALSVLGLLLDPLPFLVQRNPEILALAVPVHCAIAWILRRDRDAARATTG